MDHAGGHGALELCGLRAGAGTTVEVRAADGTTLRRRVRTLGTPAGAELFRFATINDLHLGRGEQGLHGHVRSIDRDAASHPYLAARAAVDEAVAWGAELLVVKGDICDETRDWTWDQVAKLFVDVPVPVAMLPGNHDTGRLRHFEPEEGAARHGLAMTRGVEHLDVPGPADRPGGLGRPRHGVGPGGAARRCGHHPGRRGGRRRLRGHPPPAPAVPGPPVLAPRHPGPGRRTVRPGRRSPPTPG